MQRWSRRRRTRPLGVLLRAVALGAGAPAGAVGMLALVAEPAHDVLAELEAGAPWTAMPLDRVVLALAAVALSGCAFWLAVVTVATAVEAATGASSAALRAISPQVVRRAVLLCCGLAVGTSTLLPPALAAEHKGLATGVATTREGSAQDDQAALGGRAALSGLPVPDRMAGELREAPRRPVDQSPPGPSRHTPSSPVVGRLSADPDVVDVAAVERRPGSYLVRSGDSLWSIAERLLPGASVTEVDAAWHRIHHANRRVIGPDPDLILPGTALRLPPTTSGPHHLDGPGVFGAPHERKDAS